MQCYVMLEEELLQRLYERTVGTTFRYATVSRGKIAEQHPARPRVLIVDPMLNESALEVCSTVLTMPTAWNLLCYTRLSADSARCLVALARIGYFRFIIFDHDDTSERFRATLTDVESQAVSTQLLSLLAPQTRELGEDLERVVSDLFRHPCRYRAAYDLALAAGISQASLYRAFRSIGLCSPKRLLAAARVARVACDAIHCRQSLVAARRCAGYCDQRTLRRELRLTLGCTLKSLCSRSEEEVVGELAHFASVVRLV